MADFTNIDGVYAKDTELRSGIDTLRTTVLSNTIKPLTVTKNGTYTAIPSSGTYGYSPVTVDVQEQPWQPLQDGYSNFWFELTNDTLSPWLNFSTKTENAVIDWGDGTGEQPLDTLTPTHAYAKAGKYVVKVKGVTGIATQHNMPYQGKYLNVLKYFELNSEVTSISTSAFESCVGLLNFSSVPGLSSRIFRYCASLQNAKIPVDIQLLNTFSYGYCYSLQSIIIPTSVSSIESYAFIYCISLNETHILSNTPPTLGANVFSNLPTNFIIYVPVGTGDTYKAAAGWSTYADHILEEGQTPNRMMLAKFNSDNTDNEEMR